MIQTKKKNNCQENSISKIIYRLKHHLCITRYGLLEVDGSIQLKLKGFCLISELGTNEVKEK